MPQVATNGEPHAAKASASAKKDLKKESLTLLMRQRLEAVWQGETPPCEEALLFAHNHNNVFVRRRGPDEIEAVLATIHQAALDMIQKSFGSRSLSMLEFAEAIVQTGSYNPERALAFIGGVVDLFYAVLWAQAKRGTEESTINWGQLMNYFIEDPPDLAMFETSSVGMGAGTKAHSSLDKIPQLHFDRPIVDGAKHPGNGIERIYWISCLQSLLTIEGTDSALFWSPNDTTPPSKLTPQLPGFFDARGNALFSILAAAWDPDRQDLVCLLNNRLLVSWRLRSREKGQWQQMQALEIHAARAARSDEQSRAQEKGEKNSRWKVFIKFVDFKGGTSKGSPTTMKEGGEAQDENQMCRDKKRDQEAKEVANQLNIWWSENMQMWVTCDLHGKLYLWDLRKLEGVGGGGGEHLIPTGIEGVEGNKVLPNYVLSAHTEAVTSFLEISNHKFTTTSLDRCIILWDSRNMMPEQIIKDHMGAVLCQTYLPLYSSLVSVGCEKRVYVWSIDSSAFRGVRARLSGHQANLLQVSAGQQVFVTLDEACVAVLWDAATLVSLQTSNCGAFRPCHVLCLPELGRLCLAGRRLMFYEGNDLVATCIGAKPTQEQTREKRKQEEGQSLKARAMPKWCGLATDRACLLSVTEYEVRLHSRGDPAQSRVVFNVPDGDSISIFTAVEPLYVCLLGTKRGAIYFLKYRSGFTQKVYPGRRADIEDWQQGSGGASANGQGEWDGSGGPEATRQRSHGRGFGGDGGGRSSPTGASSRPPPSPGAGQVPSSPTGRGTPKSGLACSGRGDSHLQSRGTPKVGTTPAGRADPQSPAEEDGRERAVSEDHRDGIRSRRSHRPLANAPSLEEIQRGLSRHIVCILPCPEFKRIFVGTAEGQVLVFGCSEDFPCFRWLTHQAVDPKDDDISAVTCLNCLTDWDEGLLVYGTQDGNVHVYYDLVNLRPAGSVFIPQILPERDTGQSAALSHLRLFAIPAQPDLPVSLLTLDVRSQFRVWGLQVHKPSKTLRELRLVLNGGCLQEKDTSVGNISVGQDSASAPKTPKSNKQRKSSKQVRAKVGKDDSKQSRPSGAEDRGPRGVCITAVATLHGNFALPTHAAAKQPSDGPQSAAVTHAARESAVARAREQHCLTPRSFGNLVPHLGPAADGKPTTNYIRKSKVGVSFSDAPHPAPDMGSDTEGEAEEVIQKRVLTWPGVSLGNEDNEDIPSMENPQVVDGDRFIWFADSQGRIWCLDLSATVEAAAETSMPITVTLGDPLVLSALAGKPRNVRSSLRTSAPLTINGAFTVPKEEPTSPLRGSPPVPNPAALKVAGMWHAHASSIVSLVPVSSPPGFVSVDVDKEVKVWSTQGDLWGHFSLRSVDGQPPAVAVWPPPHILGAQLTFARIAKDLCPRLGLQVRRGKEKQRGGAVRRASTKLWQKKVTAVALAREVVAEASQAVTAISAGGDDLVGRRGPRDRLDSTLSESTVVDDPAGLKASATATPSGKSNASSQAEMCMTPAGGSSAATAATTSAAHSAQPTGAVGETEGVSSPEAENERPDSPDAQQSQAGAESKSGNKPVMSEADRKRHLGEMLKRHAFSRGFKNYQQFSKRGQGTAPSHKRGDPTAQIEAYRQELTHRPPSAFGVELITRRDVLAWGSCAAAAGGLGTRSASEGALLRYAQGAVEDMTRSVRESLGVDVSSTNVKKIRRPSFVARLDIAGISEDPLNPKSATAQAVLQVCDPKPTRQLSLPAMKPLMTAGSLTVGRRTKAT